MANDKNSAYRSYLKSLVSEETSSDESEAEINTPPSRKRPGQSLPELNERKTKFMRKNIRPNIDDEEEDPQEGPSRTPAFTTHLENDPEKRRKVGNLFKKGTIAFSDKNVDISVQSIANQRNTRFRADDHLYQINISTHRRTAPLLLSLETAIREALTFILLKLKSMYGQNLHHQLYLTIIEQNILHGLNTGNYDINSPANVIVNRAMTILHSYLKSKQTLRLNNSFKIQIKVLSHRHAQHLMYNKPNFKKHIFRNFSRFRN